MKRLSTKNLVLMAIFLALGLLLPFLAGQIPQIGNMLLPMHFPVLICGIVCGWQYGLGLGLVLPILRFFLFGMPPLYPIGIAMAFEMAVYGAVIGLVYRLLPQKPASVYIALVTAMLSGRIVWGSAQVILLGLAGSAFTWELFIAGAFLNAVPGIVLQIVFVPAIIIALQKTGVINTYEHTAQAVPEALE